MSNPDLQPPVNPLPPLVVLVFLAMAGIEAALSLGAAGLIGGPEAIGWRLALVREYGFTASVLDWMAQTGNWQLTHLKRLLTYPFVFQGFTHAVFAMVLLLALGKLVAEAMGQIAFAVIFVVSGIGGAVIYALLLSDIGWLIGGFPSVYGLIGGYSFILWRNLGAAGEPQARAFALIGLLMAVQLIWGILFGASWQWVAELAGFFCGFGLSFVLAPGAWQRLRDRLRQR
ncbi:MAG: rhomboid family intramembrane serine protease [Pseudomonadota bacterium]